MNTRLNYITWPPSLHHHNTPLQEKAAEKAAEKAEKAAEKAEKAATAGQFDPSGQIIPVKQQRTYTTADGVEHVSHFGWQYGNELLLAARRKCIALCEGMTDTAVLGKNIDTQLHAVRLVLYCYRFVGGCWQLLPPRSTFPLMLDLHLSPESRRAIVHDVQAWYDDPSSKLKHSEKPCARNYTAFTTVDAGQGEATFGHLLGYKQIMQPLLTCLAANGVFSAPKTGAGGKSGSQSKVALMTGKGEEAGLHHDRFKHEKMEANSHTKAWVILAIAETPAAVHRLELQERMEWLPANATHAQPVIVAPRYTASLWLNDLRTNEQYAHNGGQADGDGARVLFAEDLSWHEEPAEKHVKKVTIERLRFLLGTACASIAKELRDGPVTTVGHSEFKLKEDEQ